MGERIALEMSNGKKILLVIEVIILLLLLGGLFVYGQISSKLNKISTPKNENFSQSEILVNTEAPELTGYTNIALFALDHRNNNDELTTDNSDTIIIASIDNDTKEIKLVSVYRDAFLDVGDGNYQKCNAAYALGGPQQAVSMLNTNLDLNLKDYVTVDFTAMVKAIDMLGGLDIPMTYQELVHMNNYCVETSEETNTDYTPIELPDPKPENETEILDVYHLNGVQATSYCRIRYTASMDFGRTERQRLVIQLMTEKAKKSSISTLSNIMDTVFPYVETSFDKAEILKLAMGILSYKIDETTGFPSQNHLADVEGKGSVVIPATLESNVIALHKFLFPKESYEPSYDVTQRSNEIIQITGYAEGGTNVEDYGKEEKTTSKESSDTENIEPTTQPAATQTEDNNYEYQESVVNDNYGYAVDIYGYNDYGYNYDQGIVNGGYDYNTGMTNENYDYNAGTGTDSYDYNAGTGTDSYDYNAETGTDSYDYNTGTDTVVQDTTIDYNTGVTGDNYTTGDSGTGMTAGNTQSTDTAALPEY